MLNIVHILCFFMLFWTTFYAILCSYLSTAGAKLKKLHGFNGGSRSSLLIHCGPSGTPPIFDIAGPHLPDRHTLRGRLADIQTDLFIYKYTYFKLSTMVGENFEICWAQKQKVSQVSVMILILNYEIRHGG